MSDNLISPEWAGYIEAVKSGEIITEDKMVPVVKQYEFDIDHALNHMDLTFGGYVPSRDALEFFNLMRLVQGEDFEVENSLMHYFLIDLVFGNIERHQYPYSKEIQDKIRINPRKIAIMTSRGLAKLQSGSSKILTPTGWTTMCEIKAGDKVITRSGSEAEVKWKTEPQQPQMYKMTLSDGTIMEVGDEHRHITQYYSRNKLIEKVRTTQEMYDVGVKHTKIERKNIRSPKESYKFRIPLMEPVRYTYKDLEIEPYMMGLGLANASFVSGGKLSCHADDMLEICKILGLKGYSMTSLKIYGENAGQIHFGTNLFKTYGSWKSRNKRIPDTYLLGSIEQRTELLRGLMDGDGHISKNGSCSYSSYGKKLAHDVKELVQGLGGIAYVKEYKKTDRNRNDIEYRTIVNIKINPFKLKRKASKWKPTKKISKAIVGLEKIECKEDGYCISVDSPCESYITEGYTVTHNSTVVTAFFPIYLAIKGKMPNFGTVMFVVGFGDSQQAGAKVQANTIRDICEDSQFCKEYFEKMRFTDEECEFTRRGEGTIKSRSFMYKVKGAAGGSVRGIRYKTERPNIIIFDDIIKNEADASSKIIMKKLRSMMYADAENALSGKKGKIIAINTPFNKNDPVYQALESGTWTPVCIPMCEEISHSTKKEDFIGAWEPMHSYERIKERFEDASGSDAMREFNQELMLRIANDEDRMIQDNMIQWFDSEELIANAWNYNWYITTDYTSTGSKGSDLSGAGLFAVNSEGMIFLVDLTLKKFELEEQYNETFNMVEMINDKVRWVEVGVETDGQQNIHIYSLKQKMTGRNTYFSFARQKNAKFGTEGIRSRLEGGNKHWRFRQMLPMFQNKKVWFAEQLRETPDMRELMEEIKYTTYTGFGSKYDDGCLVAETQICMADGRFKAIKDIIENEEILTLSNDSCSTFSTKAVVTSFNAEVYECRFKDGSVVIGTGNHPILTERGFIDMSKLLYSDKIIKVTRFKLLNSNINGQESQVEQNQSQKKFSITKENVTSVIKNFNQKVHEVDSVRLSAVKTSIVSLKKAGKRKVYNFEALDTHNYIVSNGIVVHNCDLLSQMNMIDLQFPSKKNDKPKEKSKGRKVNSVNAKIWGKKAESSDDDEGPRSSYV